MMTHLAVFTLGVLCGIAADTLSPRVTDREIAAFFEQEVGR